VTSNYLSKIGSIGNAVTPPDMGVSKGIKSEEKTELQRLKKELPKEEYHTCPGGRCQGKLNDSFRAFRKNAKDLNKEERKIFIGFFAYSPCAKQAYEFREEFTAIYDMNVSRKQAKSKFVRWISQVKKSGLLCFDNFIRLLHHRWEEITNFFVHRENSGFVEGFNNKVKVLKRRCYGIFNPTHLFQRIYLDLSGYRLFATTTIYP